MGLLMTIPGADFSGNAAGFIAPVARGLVGWWYLGGTVAETQNDRAGIANATLSGSPTIASGYVSFGGYATGQWLETQVAETDTCTLLVVARSSDTFADGAHRPMLLSNFGTDSGSGGALIGASIYIDGGTAPAGTLRLAGGQDNAGSYTAYTSTTFSTTNVAQWNFYAGKMLAAGGAGTRKLINSTTDQSNNGSPSYPRRSNTVRKFRVGASHSSAFGGTCDIHMAALYNVDLTDDEIETIYQAVKTRAAAKHSITI